MTKAELVEIVAKKTNVPEDRVEAIIETTIDIIKKTIKKNGKFNFTNFGTFVKITRKARNGRHPQTGEKIKIKQSKSVSFRPSKNFKDIL
jgi:DNA-binding protein HU-beta